MLVAGDCVVSSALAPGVAGSRGHHALAGDGSEPAERDRNSRAGSTRCPVGAPVAVPSLHNNIAALAQTFIDEGRIEGVRGDIAFVQSILETGWFGFVGSQIPPDANNFAGINAFDGRTGLPNCKNGDAAPSRCFATAKLGVHTQMQLLRSYADATTKNLPHRLISAPVRSRRRRADLGVLRR